jgi:hypothetical protein
LTTWNVANRLFFEIVKSIIIIAEELNHSEHQSNTAIIAQQ